MMGQSFQMPASQSMNMGANPYMTSPNMMASGQMMQGGPPMTMAPPMGSMAPPGVGMASMGPGMMPGTMAGPQAGMMPMGGAPFGAQGGQFMPGTNRPGMTSVANPPVMAGNVAYGPSYKMQYAKRSTADKTAVKYTGFLPLEGVYEEDTCRIG